MVYRYCVRERCLQDISPHFLDVISFDQIASPVQESPVPPTMHTPLLLLGSDTVQFKSQLSSDMA